MRRSCTESVNGADHSSVRIRSSLPRCRFECESCNYEELSHIALVAFRDAVIAKVPRQDRVCVTRQNSATNSRTSEERRSIQRFKCQGELHIIHIATAQCSVTCIQMEDHERPCWRENKFPREALEFLDKVVEAGMRIADVYRLLRMQEDIDPSNITRMILYEDNDEFQAISFLIPLKRYVSSVKEVLTDSTFKTNDMRFEMFALIGNLGCFGVPLCYMFYLKKSSVDGPTSNVNQSCGSRLLYDWMCKLREKDLRLAFFYHRQGRWRNRGCAEVHAGDARAVVFEALLGRRRAEDGGY
ncbi:hypothetical protein R1sor_010942 [Riccia sorocarpa]|uniref:Uncharacterized protein n=1 Tax=Riccia sorocarpa TaxID=122646 RepID=A0ABD3I3K0_9MARC